MEQSSMIEKIAFAIAENRADQDWLSYIPTARAALAALREPTVEMLEAATVGLPDYGYLPEEWQKMIDAALN